MKIKYIGLVLLTAFASVEAAAQWVAKDDVYTVVKEVRGTKPIWIVIFSGHPASKSPRVRYTLQFDRCLDDALEKVRCDPPSLLVGQSLDRDLSSTDREFWLSEVRGEKGLKEYRVLNEGIYACIPDDTPDMLRINFFTFQAHRLSSTKSAHASPYVQDMTGTDMINSTLGMLETLKVRLPINLDSFEQLMATTYVTGVEKTNTSYFRQAWIDQDEWLFGFGDIRGGNLSINSTTMRFAGYVPLLGGVYVTGKCEKVFRRTVYEIESNSRRPSQSKSVFVMPAAEFDRELREQGIEVRP